MRRLVVAVCAVFALAGCGLGSGLYNVTLPGGADVGDHAYTVTASSRDALDLVPQSGVRVNGVAVGRVTKIDLSKDGKYAEVALLVNGNVHLPSNAVATIQQTTPARREVRRARAAARRAADRPTDRPRHDPEVTHVRRRPGRADLRCARAAAQRRRHRATARHQRPAQRLLARARGQHPHVPVERDQRGQADERAPRLDHIRPRRAGHALVDAEEQRGRDQVGARGTVAGHRRTCETEGPTGRHAERVEHARVGHGAHVEREQGQHRQRPAYARADPAAIGEHRIVAAEVVADPAHLPVHRQGGGRDQG